MQASLALVPSSDFLLQRERSSATQAHVSPFLAQWSEFEHASASLVVEAAAFIDAAAAAFIDAAAAAFIDAAAATARRTQLRRISRRAAGTRRFDERAARSEVKVGPPLEREAHGRISHSTFEARRGRG